MRVLHINDFEHYSGAETAIRMLRGVHEKSGIKTFLATKDDIGQFTPDIIKRGSCKKIFKRIKPDVIHLHNNTAIGLAPIIVAQKLRIPVVWTLHDYRAVCPNTLLLRPNNTFCTERNCTTCNPDMMCITWSYKELQNLLPFVKCIAASNYVKERYKQFFSSLGMNFDAEINYWDADIELLNMEVEYCFNQNILFGGRRDEEKGVLYAILTIKRLIKKYPNIKLIFTGESRKCNIQQLAKIYNVEKNLIDVGYLPKEQYFKDVLFKSSIVLCLSVWEEPFNLTMLEAMALGKPIIATAVGGQQEVLGNSGILIQPKSSIDIVNSVERLFSNKSLYKRLSKQSREQAKRFVGCAERYIKVYEKLCSNTKPLSF